MSSTCACRLASRSRPGDTVHVSAYAVSNPPAAGSGTFSVSTSSDVTPASKSLTIKSPASVKSASVSTTNSSAGAQGTKVTVGFKAAGPLTSGNSLYYYYYYARGYVRLTAPGGSEFLPEQLHAHRRLRFRIRLWRSQSGRPRTNVVDEFIPPNVPVAAGDEVQVVAGNVTNPAGPSSSAKFGIATSSDVSTVEKSFGIGAASTVTGLAVSAVPSTAGSKRGVDDVSFKAKNALPYDSECPSCARFIRLTGPAGSEFEVTYYAYLVTDGSASEVAYGEVNPEGLGSNVIDVRVPSGVSIAAGDNVHVKAYGVTNPPMPVLVNSRCRPRATWPR